MWKYRNFDTYKELIDWLNERNLSFENVINITDTMGSCVTLIYKSSMMELGYKNTMHTDGYY